MNADYADLIARATVYVVAESTGWVRGVLVLKRQDDTLWIETVAVHPDHQRHGLGRMLLQFAEQHARAAGLSELRQTGATFVPARGADRKSTRLNSSHVAISYAVF